jgi:hypothetical protein
MQLGVVVPCIPVVWSLLVVGAWGARTGDRASEADDAGGIVRSALRAEIAGDNAERERLIRRALDQFPNCASAHWHAGHVRVGAEWLTLPQAQQAAVRDPRLEVYRQARDKMIGEFANFNEHLVLARWCRQQGLDAQAKYHWYKVLQLDPQHAEAMHGLGVVWCHGTLMPRREFLRLRQDAKRARLALNSWSQKLERWAERIGRRESLPETAEEALRELRAVADPEAIAALEKVLVQSDRDFALEAVAGIGRMPVQEATQALLRIAVLSPEEAVRTAATEQLRQRPLHDYAPLLLAGLEKPLESWFRVSLSPAGHVTYRHELYHEGAAADTVLNATHSFVQFDVPGARTLIKSVIYGDAFVPSSPGEERYKNMVKQHQARRAAHQYAAAVDAVERQVKLANQRSELVNARIRFVLASTVGQDMGPDPQTWWDWWQDYNEVCLAGEKPVYERYLTGYEETSLVPTVWMSCFPKGTKVWTQTGLTPIEQIQPGDLVLSQDVSTSELAYKPVLKTTVRPPCPALRLQIDHETITVTRGHPAWVTGIGWRMVKLLEEGQLIHGLHGSWPVWRIEEARDQEAHNLVVGDFSTYFVGEHGFLVHDNTYRRPTTALLPGLY